MLLNIPENPRFLLVGAGDLAKYILRRLDQYFDQYFLITCSDWDQAWSLNDKIPIVEIAGEKGIDLLDSESYEDVEPFIEKFKPNIGMTSGAKWIFRPDFLRSFQGCFFNYHPANLPRYRGGGGFSWQIMNGMTETFVTIHQMAAELDAGAIAFQDKIFVSERPLPRDFHKTTVTLARDVMDRFLQLLAENRGKAIELTKQDEGESLYFPLRDAAVNGAIDFDWDIEAVERFIRAFSYPYAGAFTYYRGKPVQIYEADIVSREGYHPHTWGMITSCFDNGDVKVMANGGCLRIKKIRRQGKLRAPGEVFKIGYKLYTPADELVKGRMHRPRYKDFLLDISRDD